MSASRAVLGRSPLDAVGALPFNSQAPRIGIMYKAAEIAHDRPAD